MIYSIAKQIGQLATVLYGKVDAVILTGATDTDVKVFTHKSLLTTPYQRYRHGDTNSPPPRAEI